MGLKFLRDGIQSVNLVAMYDLEGQPGNWNFFAHDFTNHIGPPKSTKTKLLCKKFATLTKQIQQVGLSDMSGKDQKGKTATKNIIPFSLRFEPHPTVKNLFPKELQHNNPMSYTDQLASVKADSIL